MSGSTPSAEVVGRLDELADRYALPPDTSGLLQRLLTIIASDERAPTTIRAADEAVDRHIADSLVALELEPVRRATAIADLGSGAGLPGVPLAVALPGARVSLVESAGRKATFLRGAIDLLGLVGRADVVALRAEEWLDGIHSRDLVTARAVAPLAVLVEYAAPLLVPGGALVAWKGSRDLAEEADGDEAASQTGLERTEVRRVLPWAGARDRHLYLYLKVGSTPNRYPRRPGMARKRPIAAST